MNTSLTVTDLWLVGAGQMAQAYASVLKALNVEFSVIGRSKESSTAFQTETGRAVSAGGVQSAIARGAVPDQAIVAVGVDQLAEVTSTLLEAGVTRLLVEKPGGLSSEELAGIRDLAPSAEVTIAYNRRFYASAATARQMIAEDGGVSSFFFEITEWPHSTEPKQVDLPVRNRWLLAQSSHVIDLAFHLGGQPVDWACWHKGSLVWHQESSRFAGAGVTAAGATFGFHGDWEAPGRWGLEVMTRSHRLIFRPLETLQVMSIGSLDVVSAPIDDDVDRAFKPGIHEQTRAFLQGDDSVSCSLDEQIQNMLMYEQIAGYK